VGRAIALGRDRRLAVRGLGDGARERVVRPVAPGTARRNLVLVDGGPGDRGDRGVAPVREGRGPGAGQRRRLRHGPCARSAVGWPRAPARMTGEDTGAAPAAAPLPGPTMVVHHTSPPGTR